MRYFDDMLGRECPTISTYHDEKGQRIISEVELPGVRKSDISVEAGEEGFCVKAKRGSLVFDSCFEYGHRVDSRKMRAEFHNGLLKLSVPLDKRGLHARKISLS